MSRYYRRKRKSYKRRKPYNKYQRKRRYNNFKRKRRTNRYNNSKPFDRSAHTISDPVLKLKLRRLKTKYMNFVEPPRHVRNLNKRFDIESRNEKSKGAKKISQKIRRLILSSK